MTSIFDHLRKIAQEIAGNAEARVSELDRQIAELQAQRLAANSALERAANFPVAGDYPCPICWMDRKTSILRPASSPSRTDIFRCGVCGYEDVIPH